MVQNNVLVTKQGRRMQESSGSGFEIDEGKISTFIERMTNTSALKTSVEPKSDANVNERMEISITTAIFMVLLIAISTILMLCCCKAYVLCKRRRTSTNTTQENMPNCNRRRFHQPLPARCRHNDAPPCYDDVLSGRIATMSTSDCGESFAKIIKTQSKHSTVAVKWSQQKKRSSPAPPLYSCVVSEEDQHSICDDVPPPSYHSLSLPAYSGHDRMFMASSEVAPEQNSRTISVTKRVRNVFQAVSAFVRKRPDTGSNPTNDPTLEISCDGNVMRTVSSSHLSSAPSSSSSRNNQSSE